MLSPSSMSRGKESSRPNCHGRPSLRPVLNILSSDVADPSSTGRSPRRPRILFRHDGHCTGAIGSVRYGTRCFHQSMDVQMTDAMLHPNFETLSADTVRAHQDRLWE